MKRFFLICIVALMALALASPAMAGLKLTSKGRMDVTGIWMNNNFMDLPGQSGMSVDQDSVADWFQQELVIDPTLHINEKVRIHARITLLETTWAGRGVNATSPAFGNEADYRGSTDIWVEQLYMSFPLFGGTLYVGRMSAGMWAYPFGNADQNGDRIKYVRSVGPITFVGVYEKMGESDDSAFFTQTPQTAAPVRNSAFSASDGDLDLYCLAAVIPFSKNPLIVSRQIICLLDFGSMGHDWLWMPTLMVKAGIFQFDAEAGYRIVRRHQVLPDSGDEFRDYNTDFLRLWAEAGLHPGPFSFVLGGFFVTGNASQDQNRSVWTVGQEFQPLLLTFSEDMGCLWNTAGVPNGSLVPGGVSGYKAGYFRAAYKINDTMTLRGIVGFLWADKMLYGRYDLATGGNRGQNGRDKWGTPDTFLGWEADLGFEWQFMDNLSYVVEAAFFKPGPYWDFAWGQNLSRSVFGMRHMLVINW